MSSPQVPRLPVIALTHAAATDPAIAIAASRAGALGVLNLELCGDLSKAQPALDRLAAHAGAPFGLLLDGGRPELLQEVLRANVSGLHVLLITTKFASDAELATAVELTHEAGLEAIGVVTSEPDALRGQAAGFDAIVAKGNEAGGWVGEETAFILAQRLADRATIPFWLQGGIGLHTASAARVAGAAGVVLDSQLLLARESRLSANLRARLTSMDGSQTEVIGGQFEALFRCYSRQDTTAAERLRNLLPAELSPAGAADINDAWRQRVIDETAASRDPLWALGQDAGFAGSLAERFKTVGGIIRAVAEAMTEQAEAAATQMALGPGAPLSTAHRTTYPIVQGPMTRVSDRALFAKAVAETGALPFVALALMRPDEIDPLLRETKELLGPLSWGVGILGFVPPALREEQLALVKQFKPPFALIAGGRPDHAKALEAEGIDTYLHVPSPGLLKMYLDDGALQFVLEGRECGGHIGPRSSFVLWNSAVETLLAYLQVNPRMVGLRVLFAGGIHDGLSAAMVAAIAAPLVERGVSIGVLSGTAYLFTNEAVEAGAIGSSFQQAAVEAETTIVLESAPGYATRCLPSPFAEVFTSEKQRMIAEGASVEQVKEDLENLNIGRLRIASKGINRNPAYGQDPAAPRFVTLPESERWSQGMYMIGQIATLRDETCSMAELHEEISNGSVRRLEALQSAVVEPDAAPPPCAVAIIGMSSIVPGASDLQSFWKNILNKVDAVSEVPVDRWDPRDYFDPDKAARDKIYSRWGGFIDEVPFEPLEFGMPPASLRSIEPFQLLALLMVRDALKDAGYESRPFNREKTSVILGAGGGTGDLGNGYVVRSNLPKLFGEKAGEVADLLEGVLPEWTEDSFAGLLMNVAAGRIANRFDFGGLNYTVDAACASSLTAVYLAVRDLEARTSDTVIVGGVDAIQSPFGFLCFSKTQALSPNGRSRPFDVDADGIAISEGFVSVVLKRLDDAERDGDRIYGVIRGVGGSSDGRARGLTAPRPEGQVRALRRAYANAGFSPATVGLIEAHGTGTVAGDKSELESLTTLFSESNTPPQSVAVGSVKSMIGHTKATAGVAGLVKIAKALYHHVLPPTIGVETPNPQVNSDGSPFYVSTEARPWLQPAGSTPRRAGISGFGFGGTNFHIVLEEYRGEFQERLEPTTGAWDAELFVLRAADRAELAAAAKKLAGQLDTDTRVALADLSYTINRRAQAAPGSVALSIVASSKEELTASLQEAVTLLEADSERTHTPKGVHFSSQPFAATGKVAFLFPGQGSQYVNMGRDLAVLFSAVQEEFQFANDTLAGLHKKALSSYVYPPPWFTKDEQKTLEQALTNTQVAQPALGTVETGMLRLLRGLGVDADMSAGHSYGEFAALHFAGVFSQADLLRLSEARGRFMNESTGEESGTMAAILAPMSDVEKLLAVFPDITPANLNAPKQTVISGTRDAIAKAIAWCGEQNINARPLPVACAFHSPLVAPASEKLLAFMQTVEFMPPRSAVYSNTTAALYPADPDAIRNQLAKHLISPVRFSSQVEAMYEAGARLFIEVGPRQVMSGLVDQNLGEQPHLSVPLDNPNKPGLWSFLNGIAALVSEGVDVDLKALYQGRDVRSVNLDHLPPAQPTYPPTTWLVNGGRARPANAEVRRADLPLKIHFGDAPAPQAVEVPAPIAPPQPGHALAATMNTGGAPASLPPPASEPMLSARNGVMSHFQDVMTHYLYAQESVMRDLLNPGHTQSSMAPQLTAPAAPAQNAPAPEARSEAPSPEPQTPAAPITKRYLSAVRPVAPAFRNAGLDPQGVVLLIGANEVSAEVATLLTAAGLRSCVLQTDGPDRNGQSRPDTLSVPGAATEEQVTHLVAQVHARFGVVSAVLYLDALTARPVDDGSWLILDRGIQNLFWLARLLHTDLQGSAQRGGAAFMGVTALGGGFSLDSRLPATLQDHYWLPGFLKSLSFEWDAVRVKAIDLAKLQPSSAARHILDELLTADAHNEVGYDAIGTRQVVELHEAAGQPARSLTLGNDAVILVTGGARGITAECAIALAQEVPATYVLVGRTQLPQAPEDDDTRDVEDERTLKGLLLQKLRGENAPATPRDIERAYSRLIGAREVADTLQRFSAAGANVFYEVCDLTDPNDFTGLVTALYARFGRLDGVIHGAGVIEDRLLVDKSFESFQRVVATKVRPLEVLLATLKPESLRFLALFSSVSARKGNRGQVDYAAANEVLNKVAAELSRRWPARVVAMNWGPWRGSGMVSAEVMRQFSERGIDPIPLSEGTAAFVQELLATGEPAEVVIGALSGAMMPGDAGNVMTPSGVPLLHGATAARLPNGALTVKKTLALQANRYLEDHMLDGKPVVPFAFAMEMMTEAGIVSAPGLHVAAIRDVRVFHGLIVEAGSLDLTVQVQAASSPNGHGPTAVATIREGARAVDSYRATLELTDSPRPDVQSVPPAPLAAAEHPAPAFTLESAYRDWLFHGPAFQAIASIEAFGPGGATAMLMPSDPKALLGRETGAWLMDPILIDAAFQLQLIWGRDQWDVTLLPSRVARLTVLAPQEVAGQPIRCEMRIRTEALAPISHADFWFYASDGTLLARLEDFESSGSTALNRLAGKATSTWEQ